MTSDDGRVERVENGLGRGIYVDLADERARAMVEKHGDVNPGSLSLWRYVLESRSWDTIIDVGANYGEMLLGADLPDTATLVAFEPIDRVRELLERSLAEAGVTVDLQSFAISDRVGEALFTYDATWSGKSSLEAGDPDDELMPTTVKTTTLDAYLAGRELGATCVKVDVEGHESAVLRGMTRIARDVPELAVMVEVIHLDEEAVTDLAEAWQMFAFDRRREFLVRVPPVAGLVAVLAASQWCYAQDVVLVPKGQPTPWDDGASEPGSEILDGLRAFVAAAGDREREVSKLEKWVEIERAKVREARKDHKQVTDELERLRVERDLLQGEFETQWSAQDRLRRKLRGRADAAKKSEAAIRAELNAIKASRTWRVTNRLRQIFR